MKVFVAGEGPSELGDWAKHASYRDDPPQPGVIEALLRRVRTDGWRIAGAVVWKEIRKFKVLPGGGPEMRNVLGAALQAAEAGCQILAFVRDRDRDEERQADVGDAIRRAPETLDPCPTIVGGVAVEMIESWLLSLGGERHAERLRRPKENLPPLGVSDMTDRVAAADLSKIPDDAISLRAWLDQARSALGPSGDVTPGR